MQPNVTKKGRKTQEIVDENQHNQKMNSKNSCAMVIEILNDILLLGLPMSSTNKHIIHHDSNHNIENISFKYIILKYKLDFKKSVAFEIMSCSFILKSLKKKYY